MYFDCCNSETLTWQDAFHNIDNIPPKPLCTIDLQAVGMLLEENLAFTVDDIADALHVPEDQKRSLVKQFTRSYPLMLVGKGEKCLLINLHELIISPEVFGQLLQDDVLEDKTAARAQPEKSKPQENQRAEKSDEKSRPGRPSTVLKLPEIIRIATEFLKQHSFVAEIRRSNTATGSGVLLEELRRHLLEQVPGLKEHGISKDTVHHLLVVPRKGTIRSHRFKV